MKKRIFAIITIIIVLITTIIPTSAMGMSSHEIYTTKQIFGAPESLTTRMDYYIPLTDGTIYDGYVEFNESISKDYIETGDGVKHFSGFKTTLSGFTPPLINVDTNTQFGLSKWNVTKRSENSNYVEYSKTITENLPSHNNTYLIHELKIIGNEIKYIHKDEIHDFISEPQIVDIYGKTTTENMLFEIDIQYIEKASEAYIINTASLTYEEQSGDIRTFIDRVLSNSYGDIIGISNYKVKTVNKMQYNATNSLYQGIYIFDSKIESSHKIYNAEDFLSQTPYGNSINGTKEIIIDNGQGTLTLDGFIEGIKSALAVDLFGIFSILDILTIIVGISITIWFLKVFAGG